MKIITYNVNGIRAAINKDFLAWLKVTQPDIIGLQEVKATEIQIDIEVFNALGYHVYWFAAEKKGYSGVAILSKKPAVSIEKGIGVDAIDVEGRHIRADFEHFSFMSIYIPSGTNSDRLGYKEQFCGLFTDYTQTLLTKQPKLIIGGDFNICHQPIDIHDPIRNAQVSGFLPWERAWLDHYVTQYQWTDAFRYVNQNPHHYSWWSYRANARQNNKGWRIDYQLVSQSIQSEIQQAYMLPLAMHSDHCPVVVELNQNPTQSL